MTVSLFSQSSGVLPIGQETFFDVGEVGVYIYEVDLDLMQDGDVLYARVYQINASGGVAREVDFQGFYGADGGLPGLKAFHSEAFSNNLTDAQSLRFAFLQSNGTGRALPRKIIKHL